MTSPGKPPRLTPDERAELDRRFAEYPPEGGRVPYRSQLRVMTAAPLRRVPPGFVIYGQGRTGSTLLGELIGSHTDVEFGDEVLRGPVLASRYYVAGLRRAAAPRSYGLHVKPAHLARSQGVRDRRGWLELVVDDRHTLVHLSRDNLLRHVLSNVTRNATGTSHFRAGDGRRAGGVVVDVPDLLRTMGSRELCGRQEREELEGLPHICVEYERDLLAGPEAWERVTATVHAALGLTPQPPSTTLRRINAGRLTDLIANYDEVAGALRGTPWERFLDDAR